MVDVWNPVNFGATDPRAGKEAVPVELPVQGLAPSARQ